MGEASKLFRCAWLIADKAAQYLGAIVGEQVPAMALLKAAGVRLAKKNVR